MVAHLVRLKLRLTVNGLKRSVWMAVGFAVAALYGFGVLVMVLSALAYVSTQPFELRELVGVFVGASLVLAWWLVPLVAFGLDATVDPARFATFPVRRRSLLLGLTIAGMLGLPGVLTVLGSFGSVVLWRPEPAAVAAGVLGAALAVLTCIVGSRALTTVLTPLVVKRKVREIGLALLVVPLVVVGPVLSRILPKGFDIRDAELGPAVTVVGWTPLGAPWAIAPDVAAERWAQAGGRLLVSVATVALLAWAWSASLGHALTEPARDSTRQRTRGLGLFGRLPSSPVGAVTARCLTYWARDPRYAMAVVLVPVVPVVFTLVDPRGSLVLLAAPLGGFLMGWGISADVAYDGTAYWMHAASPLRGAADRWGRALAAGSLGVVVVVALAVACGFAGHRPETIPALLGAGLGTLGTALGVSSVASALVVYPVRQPGDNPFSTRQGATMPAMLTQLAGWTCVALLASPTIVLTVTAIAGRQAWAGWAALLVGPLLGAVVLAVGARLGGRLLERTSPDLLRRLLAMT